ncbi:MAG TPA: hypothetical protein VJW77_04290 [Terriglobia bacterium]|nr:hypothetical protein [Terriglobia bacterium]
MAVEGHWVFPRALVNVRRIEDRRINDTHRYYCLHRLLPKAKVERHLTAGYGELCQAEFDVLLYNLTSSFVKGAAEIDAL